MTHFVAAGMMALAVLAAARAETAAPAVTAFKVAPATRYALTITVAADSTVAGEWELQVSTPEDDLPLEGVFRNDWQRIVPGIRSYTHQFWTPRDGATLKVFLRGADGPPPRAEFRLDEVTDRNLVLNGGFACGLSNYSGWTDRRLAVLGTNGAGRIVLACEPQGFAVTDPIPVDPGAIYRFADGSYGGGRVLVYDRDLLRIGRIDDADPVKKPVLRLPADAAYVRIAFCDGRDWSGRVPVIDHVGLERVEGGSGAPAPACPPYPGEIVVSPGAPLPEVRAAREIQHWVRRIGGREMRVLAAPTGRDNLKVFVGTAWAQRRFPDDVAFLEGSDGFAIRKVGGGIYIFGARPAGALFGAMHVLERNTDLIFARPDKEYGAVYTENPALELTADDFRMRPAFAFRTCNGTYTQPSDDTIWQGRAGMNSPASLYNGFERAEMGGAPQYDANFMATIAQSPRFSFERCKAEHPGFFAYVNGTRQIVPQGYICCTAPGIAEALAEGLGVVVDRARARGERLENIGIRTRDGWTVCSCDSCMTPIPLPDGSLLRPRGDTAEADPLFFSTRLAVMLNRVADLFGKTHPETPITVPAYIYSSVPPAIHHAPSLIPSFCAYDTCSLRFPILEGEHNDMAVGREWENKFREYLRRNGTDHGRLSMFAYYYCAGFSAVADSAAADWLAMVRSGRVSAVHMDGFTPEAGEALSAWDYQAVERWVMARLMWDPARDPQELREEYIRKAFGPAAPDMLAFYAGIRRAWKDPAIHYGPNCHASSADLFDNLIVKPGQEQTLRALLVSAERKAVHPASRKLVQRTLLAFDSFAGSLNRLDVPLVRESTAEWDVPHSAFWLQALKLGPFKRVSTWDDFKGAAAAHPTQVAVMRDRDHVYFRFQADGAAADDRVELVLTAGRGKPTVYMALDRAGGRSAMRDFAPCDLPGWEGVVSGSGASYIALFKIALGAIPGLDAGGEAPRFHVKCSRLAADGIGSEESSLTGAALTRTHYMNYWTALSVAKEGGAK